MNGDWKSLVLYLLLVAGCLLLSSFVLLSLLHFLFDGRVHFGGSALKICLVVVWWYFFSMIASHFAVCLGRIPAKFKGWVFFGFLVIPQVAMLSFKASKLHILLILFADVFFSSVFVLSFIQFPFVYMLVRRRLFS